MHDAAHATEGAVQDCGEIVAHLHVKLLNGFKELSIRIKHQGDPSIQTALIILYVALGNDVP